MSESEKDNIILEEKEKINNEQINDEQHSSEAPTSDSTPAVAESADVAKPEESSNQDDVKAENVVNEDSDKTDNKVDTNTTPNSSTINEASNSLEDERESIEETLVDDGSVGDTIETIVNEPNKDISAKKSENIENLIKKFMGEKDLLNERSIAAGEFLKNKQEELKLLLSNGNSDQLNLYKELLS